MLTKVPKGMKDVLPGESARWQAIEKEMRKAARLAGYREIRTPVVEHTELFARSAGESSDVVRKEMYTFQDKGDRSVTLKPESTAGTVRAFLESGLYAQALPLKMYYLNAPHFRYEAPQSGRLREHHQFGMECFGASQPSTEAELIVLLVNLLGSFGLKNLSVRINSIGCPNCRPQYQQAFRSYLNEKKDQLCKACQERIEINPMRTLDCKEEKCKQELKDAPVMLDNLCDECSEHFAKLKEYLNEAGIKFVVDARIVRGLDYYTKTVFEIITDTPNGELTVCGGGRYDGLVEQIGGPSIPAVGFGMGIERVLMLLDQLGEDECKVQVEDETPDVFVACLNKSLSLHAFKLMDAFRQAQLSADMDHQGRSLKAQFKYADKLGAKHMAILGDDELAKGVVKLRDMATKEEWEVALAEAPAMLAEKLHK
ncbi:MAG: histidine--tRNA ligase [Clostridiales bacterium]|nr:histidine--tRNA ligase [Clostridiales bacterium]